MAAYSEANFDALNYFKVRPTYPEEILNLIYSWHLGGEDRDNSREKARFDTALDLGCGPGQLTYPLSLRFKHVIAMDPSSVMLEMAKKVIPEKHLHLPVRPKSHSIEFVEGNAESTSLPDQSIDLIVAGAAAHWFKWFEETDGKRVWREFERILRPNGTVCFIGLMPGRIKGYEILNKEMIRDIYTSKDKLQPYFPTDSKSPFMVGSSFYEFIPKPKGQKWLEDSTKVIKIDVDEDLYPQSKTAEKEPVPDWIRDALHQQGNQELESVVNVKGPFEQMLKGIRSISGYILYLKDHPEENELIATNKDAAARWLQSWLPIQARRTAAERLNKNEADISKEEEDQFMLSLDTEVQHIYSTGIFLARRSSI